MKLSVVIPALNEEQNIKITIDELLLVLEKSRHVKDFQVIVVDDHSTDRTFDIVKDMKNPRISCIRLSRRRGSHIAIRAGLREATGDAALFIAADGQDDPVCLEKMLDKLRGGANAVWGVRKSRSAESWRIKLPARMFYKVLRLLGGMRGVTVDVSRANFFLLDRAVIDAVNSCPESNTSLFGLITWVGFNQDSVEYERNVRRFGKSNWSFFGLIHLATDWIIGFSSLPMTCIFNAGAVVFLLSLLYIFCLIIAGASGHSVEGWSITIAVVLFLGGIQMIMTGVIGEYLWRSLDESRKRPLYFIEKRTG